MSLATLPEVKRCARCRRDCDAGDFRVQRARGALRLASYCLNCERIANRERLRRKRRRGSYVTVTMVAVDEQWRQQQEEIRREFEAANSPIGPREQPWRGRLDDSERLTSGPLRAWLDEYLPKSYSTEDRALALMVSAHTLQNIYEKPTVNVTVVDRIFTRIGRPDLLDVLYPL